MKKTGLLSAAAVLLVFSMPAHANSFNITNLVTDDQSANPAQITDPFLQNAWGIAGTGTSPFWVGDNGTGVATLYSVNPLTNVTTKSSTTQVTIPGDGTVTGVANAPQNVVTSFNGDNFLFVSEDGTVSGWRGALGPMATAETFQVASPANEYKGAAFAITGGHGYLYAANFEAGTIDVYKGDAAAPTLAGSFTDPTLPAGYAPFNVKLINGALYVTYALRSDPFTGDEVSAPGNGFVSKFDLLGNFLGRVASGGTLDSPWGLAVAPASFGNFAGDLLVGNFGDGTINAFDFVTNAFRGQLTGRDGTPLFIDGLWSLIVGGGGNEGNAQSIYFTAGPDDEAHGLFGVISPLPEPASIALFGAGLVGLAALRRRRKDKQAVMAAARA
jgi:uncharacterized protein (TIGR03118 family)